MTQKEKIMKAEMMARRVKNIAARLRQDARDFDCKFPKQRADELDSIVDAFFKNEMIW